MRLGVIVERGVSRVVLATEGTEVIALPEHDDLQSVIADPQWRDAVHAALTDGERRDGAGVAWAPPLRRPGKVLCVALNHSANPDRIIRGPSTPAMFVKPSSSLIGHREPIVLKEKYGRVHPEPELAVVIGVGGADIPVDQAIDHVFGYTILNDLTSPTMRDDDTFHYRAIHPSESSPDGIRYVESWVSYPARYKGADAFGPIGPWVTTRDAIPDPHALRVTCSHDGEVVTDDSTANLRFSVAEVISFASEYLTLEAGDIVAMGTALRPSSGGGAVQNVDLARLGGTIEVAIEGIGTLSNPVEMR